MPRPRINHEHRTPTFNPIERYDPNTEPGEDNKASLTLFAEYPDDEFPHFEVSTTMLVKRSGELVEADLNDDDAYNDPLAVTTVRVTGPMRLEAEGGAIWGLTDSDSNADPGLEMQLPGREGIEVDQHKVETAATILANALRDAIHAGLYD